MSLKDWSDAEDTAHMATTRSTSSIGTNTAKIGKKTLLVALIERDVMM